MLSKATQHTPRAAESADEITDRTEPLFQRHRAEVLKRAAEFDRLLLGLESAI